MVSIEKCIGYYKFSRDAGDASGSNNVGVINGATNVSGKIGNGYSFDGTNDYINIGTVLDNIWGDNKVTVSAWVNFSAFSGKDTIMGTILSGGLGGLNLFYENSTSLLRFSKVGISGGNCDWSSASFTTGSWIHIVAVSDNNGMDLWVNGTKRATNTNTSSWVDSTTDTGIGMAYVSDTTTENPLDGIIDEVAIWKRPLTDTEIQDLYNAGAGVQFPFNSNLLANGCELYYKLDTSGNIYDASGEGRTGTINGATFTTSGFIGSAYNFDGSNDNIAISNGYTVGTTFTVQAWINPDNPSTYGTVYDKASSGANRNMRLLVNSDDTVLLQIQDGTNSASVTSTGTVTAGSWNHVVGTYDGSSLKIYLNNSSPDSTSTTLIPYSGVTAGNYLGARWDNIFNYDGRIDEFALWSKTLDASEVGSLYNSGTGLQYPFFTGSAPAPTGWSKTFMGIVSYSKINGIDAGNITRVNGISD